MVTMITAPAPLNGDNNNPQGHCNQCRKIWTLNERQGVCPWCGKPASCITATSKPRHVKSRSNGRRKQPNGNGHNGYDQLQGQWLAYYNVASRFTDRVKSEDKEDILHTIIATLADVERNNGHKPIIDSEGNTTELGELIADDKALDLGAWIDARTFLLGFPQRLLTIAYKLGYFFLGAVFFPFSGFAAGLSTYSSG